MSEMQDKDSFEVFVENLKKAASLARQLGKSTGVKSWTMTAAGLDGIRSKGEALYNRPAPSRQEKLKMVDLMVEKNAVHPGSDKVN